MHACNCKTIGSHLKGQYINKVGKIVAKKKSILLLNRVRVFGSAPTQFFWEYPLPCGHREGMWWFQIDLYKYVHYK